jgi:hypothetical protein
VTAVEIVDRVLSVIDPASGAVAPETKRHGTVNATATTAS